MKNLILLSGADHLFIYDDDDDEASVYIFFLLLFVALSLFLSGRFFFCSSNNTLVCERFSIFTLSFSLSLDAARHKNIPSKLERVYTAVKKKKEENTISRDITTIAARVNQDSAAVAFTISRRPFALPTGHAISFDYFYY